MRMRHRVAVVAGLAIVMSGVATPASAADDVNAGPQLVTILDEAPVVLATGDMLVAEPVTGLSYTQQSGLSCQWSAHLHGTWESGGPGTYTAQNKATCSATVDEIFYTATLYRNDEPVVSANDRCTWPCSGGVSDFDQSGCGICGGYFFGYFTIYIVSYDGQWRPKANCTVGDNGHQLTCRYRSATQYAPS